MAAESFLNVALDRDPRRSFERFLKNTSHCTADGGHDSMLQAPAVETLAQGLQACLTAQTNPARQ
jgi:thioesterase domain-containing protein